MLFLIGGRGNIEKIVEEGYLVFMKYLFSIGVDF